MSSCTHLFGAGIALPLPALCVHTAENPSSALTTRLYCLLNPPKFEAQLGEGKDRRPLQRGQLTVFVSPHLFAEPDLGAHCRFYEFITALGACSVLQGSPPRAPVTSEKSLGQGTPWHVSGMGHPRTQRWGKLRLAVSQRKLLKGEELPSGLPRESFLIHNAWK